jgi:thioredoxin reductase (NADPH)
MSVPPITVYGAHWCPDCRQAKKFLSEQLVQYNWVDIEQDKEAEQYVLQVNDGKRIIPTIVFDDGSVLVEPSNAELAEKLDLQTEARKPTYDLIVVGGGPAALTAAIYAAREGIETLLIERSGLGGQAGSTGAIENFPGFPQGISGAEFAERVVQQARRYDVEILQATEVAGLGRDPNCVGVQTAGGKEYQARALLIATGAHYRRLGVPGEETYVGAGLHFCATCDGPFYKGSAEIVVVGGGNSAAEEALHLTKFTDKVTMLVRADQLRASRFLADKLLASPRVDVRFRTIVEAFEGRRGKLTAVRIRELPSGTTSTLHPAAAFIFVGLQPNSTFARSMVEMTVEGFIVTGHDLMHHEYQADGRVPFAFETSQPGIFAAGDVRLGSTNQIASAVGEGAAAAIAIREYLKKV